MAEIPLSVSDGQTRRQSETTPPVSATNLFIVMPVIPLGNENRNIDKYS
jgi:hypothetical protein